MSDMQLENVVLKLQVKRKLTEDSNRFISQIDWPVIWGL